MNQLKAKRFQTSQEKMESSFARPWLLRGQRLKLEASKEIMPQDADLLPGRVGAIVVGGNNIKGPLSFEFAEGLLLSSSPGHEIPQRGSTESQIGSNG